MPDLKIPFALDLVSARSVASGFARIVEVEAVIGQFLKHVSVKALESQNQYHAVSIS